MRNYDIGRLLKGQDKRKQREEVARNRYGKEFDVLDRGSTFFVTDKEYEEEGLYGISKYNTSHPKEIKTITHNDTTYYYTSDISDVNAKKLAESHPGGRSPYLERTPGGSEQYMKPEVRRILQGPLYPELLTPEEQMQIAKAKEAMDNLIPEHKKPVFKKAATTIKNEGQKSLDTYNYSIEQLLNPREVFGEKGRQGYVFKYMFDNRQWDKIPLSVKNYDNQIEDLEYAILNGVTNNSRIYEKFKKMHPEIDSPAEFFQGHPIYKSDDDKNKEFYDTLYDYFVSHPDLAKEKNIDIRGFKEDFSPSKTKIIIQNGIIDTKLKEAGLITPRNKDIIAALSPQGKLELMDSDYLSEAEITDEVQNYIDNNEDVLGASDAVHSWLRKMGVNAGIIGAGVLTKNVGVTAAGASFIIVDMWNSPYTISPFRGIKRFRENTSEEARANLRNNNDKILEYIVSADNAAKEKLAEKDTEKILESLNDKYKYGELSEKDINDMFLSIASTLPHYAGIVNLGSDEFNGYTLEQKMKDIAEYSAIYRLIGPEAAFMTLDARFQNHVSDQQDHWDYVGNTFLGFWTEFASTVGNTATVLPSIVFGAIDLVADTNYLPNYLGGTMKNVPTVFDPTYYQDIRQYNTFSTEDIAKIKEAGGVSPYTNIRPAGTELDVASWYTALDVIEQSGQLAAMTAVGAGTNYGLGKIGRMGDKTRNFLTAATTAVGGAQAEAVGAFKDATELLGRTLDRTIEEKFKEVRDTQLSIYLDTKQYQQDVENLMNELREDSSYDRYNDIALRNKAEELVKGQFLLNLRNSINDEYSEARNQIGRYAAGSYAQAFLFNSIKTALTNSIVLKNVFTKPMSAPKPKVPGTYENGRLKTFTSKIDQYGKYGQRAGSVMLSEGSDELGDGIFNNWAIKTGNDTYSRYLSEKWDMDAYLSNASNWFAGFFTQGANTFSHRFEDQYIFEAALGALSAGGVNVNPINAYKAIRGKSLLTDEELLYNLAVTENTNLTNKEKADRLVELTVLEKAGRIFGGSIAAMAEVDTELRNSIIEGVAAAENIAKYWDDFLGSTDLVSKLLDAKHSEGKSELEMRDSYDNLRFALASLLAHSEDQLANSGIELQQLKELYDLLQRAADGDISEDDIDKFLNNPDNKNFIQSLNK